MCAGAVLRSRRVCFVSVERKTILNADNVWHFVHRAYCLQELWYERSWQLIRRKGWQISKALSDTEETLKEAANATGERAQELCEKAFAQLKLAKDRAAEVQGTIVERGKQMTYATDGYVHRHPWQSAGIAVCIGVLLGLLINRK